jgi:hypothetical protein
MRAIKVKPHASTECADAGDQDAGAHKACADAGDQGADVCKPGGTRAIKVKTRASKACAAAVHQGEDACKQGVSDAGDQGEDASTPGVCGVWRYLCCILLSIAVQWGVGVRRVPSFLGFPIHQED